MIIPARELVQIFAKDVALGGDELPKGPSHDKRKDLMIDSAISCSHYSEERELERWAPDGGDSECIELEKYDRKGNRSWDQFETNAALFGVKSTFNEELYTTKLERGPHMRELEKHASRIAREIEGEDTKDIHLAEERGLYLDDDLDHDEEIKYSAVCRDTDNTKYKSSTSVSCNTNPIDSLTRAGNTDPKFSSPSTADEESSSHVFDTNLSATFPTSNVSQLASHSQPNKHLSIDESRFETKKTLNRAAPSPPTPPRPTLGTLGSAPLVTAAAPVVAVPLLALAEQIEKPTLFDFDLTLLAIATEFLLLMVVLDKFYFSSVGKFMDEWDAKIRAELGDVKGAFEEVKQLED
ncbi:hypothetical protein GUJ93_ZPchr0007g5917 [Zizania palustris]|uniref:LsmAD domain-containing protein n=1 Tax=Zizania palustris TaxID=103762 RepID=A0A8J5SVM1_ZIZPA|nr:hypothetical protein GUJ93_ZPchr0007g5917 [Zizania palustris]